MGNSFEDGWDVEEMGLRYTKPTLLEGCAWVLELIAKVLGFA